MVLEFNEIVEGISEMLRAKGINVMEQIRNLGQIALIERRINGVEFTIEDYLRGLMYALSSQTRTWQRDVMPYIDQIDRILFNYNINQLVDADQEELRRQIQATRANIFRPERTIENLVINIPVIQHLRPLIEETFEDLGNTDNLIQRINNFAQRLSDPNSADKLSGIGIGLVGDFLKNLGIPSLKLDTHIKRIGGTWRLGFLPTINDESTADTKRVIQAQTDFNAFSENINIEGVPGLAKVVYLDNLIWMFGAEGYGEICKANPECNECLLRDGCNHP